MEKKNDTLAASVRCLKGVGPRIEGFLAQKGITTVEDLFYLLPIRYEDKRNLQKINEIREGEKALIVATVISSRSVFFPRSRRKAYEAIVTDGTGTLTLVWFHVVLPYVKGICGEENVLLLSGRVHRFGSRLQIVHPEVTVLESETEIDRYTGVVPVYPEIGGLKQGVLRRLIFQAFEEYGRLVTGILAQEEEKAFGLMPLIEALKGTHYPSDGIGSEIWAKECVSRLIFEEYLLFQIALQLRKGRLKEQEGIHFEKKGNLRTRFEAGLTFPLTESQERVISEIEEDMGRREPMNRLLQGDVGSGKTVCALMAACTAIDNGYQVAIMAPTEVLAEQHYLAVHKAFENLGVSVVFLRGTMGRKRKEILADIERGKIPVIVGTHAIIQKDVIFKALGLVVIDEQHRFGVLQRKRLREKGRYPDILVMTATPIPRTLSMVIYGDLDVSIIDEMPKGRRKVWTKIFTDESREKVRTLVETELKKGHQAYVVYPLVENSEKLDLLNAKKMAVYLQESVFPFHTIGLLHGRMKAEEKEQIMARFKDRDIDILVCTTVIEVGIDVPNATIIVIEHAERFGLSQLHQLRGRVGRGTSPSKCVLVSSARRTDLATRRLKVMEETGDGFQIAEEDMRLRGPGEIFGVRQSGVPEFRVGDIVRDGDIMSRARRVAREVVPRISERDRARIKELTARRWGKTVDLSDIA